MTDKKYLLGPTRKTYFPESPRAWTRTCLRTAIGQSWRERTVWLGTAPFLDTWNMCVLPVDVKARTMIRLHAAPDLTSSVSA